MGVNPHKSGKNSTNHKSLYGIFLDKRRLPKIIQITSIESHVNKLLGGVHMKKFLIFAVLGLIAFSFMAYGEGKVKEESTGLTFDKAVKFSTDSGAPEMICSGTGVRKKVIIKVYGAAIYIEPAEAKKVLGKYIPKQIPEDMDDFIEELCDNNQFWGDFIGGEFHKIILMRFVRDVGFESITGAYKDAFKAYLKDNSEEAKKTTATFLGFFNEEIKEGQEMTLRFSPDGTIIVEYAGKARGSIKNVNIAKALLTNWFGTDPISDDIKEGGIKYLYDVLK